MGTALGTYTFNSVNGDFRYTASAAESGTLVTVDYEVCKPGVCDTATINITVLGCEDDDLDGVCNADDTFPNDSCQPNTHPNWVDQPSNDCDGDGLTTSEETTGIDDLNTARSQWSNHRSQ